MFHGGRIVAQALRREGIDHVFTLCGGHIQNIYDGCIDEGIRVVDVRHEQTAGHAADGYARVTGRPGVALVTAGPGVTDVVTAVANAQRAGVPMLVIGGAGPLAYRHMGSLQDMDHVELMRPITKWSASVTETRRLDEFMTTAFRIAMTGVPGPVFLEMPLDILMNFAEPAPASPGRSRPQHVSAPSGPSIDEAVRLLDGAERPVLVCGSQLRWSHDPAALIDFLTKRPMPAYLNGMARGALPHGHPCLMARSRRQALKDADVLVIVGTPFDFRLDYGRESTISPTTKIIQIDLDARELGRNRGVDVGIPADSGLALSALEIAMKPVPAGDWLARIAGEEAKKQAAIEAEVTSGATSPPSPLWLCREVARYVEEDSIIVGDGGDFVATAAYTMPLSWPGLWMDPGPLGTLGVGPGYAMAAKLARPKSRVILMYGDGSFGLHGMEFEALARQNIPVVAVIGNDAGWTQILRGQRDMFGDARLVATKLEYTRYEKIAEALGGVGFYAETPEQVRESLAAAFASGKPAIVNVKIASSDFRKGAISV